MQVKYLVVFREFILREFEQFHVVLVGHSNVYVIVPRDETLMPYSSQTCAGYGKVSQIMAFADVLKDFEYL